MIDNIIRGKYFDTVYRYLFIAVFWQIEVDITQLEAQHVTMYTCRPPIKFHRLSLLTYRAVLSTSNNGV